MKVCKDVSALALACAMGAFWAASDAGAVTYTRKATSNPAGICQSALPVFDTAIRKRPMAVQNEGSTNAFITCSFTSQGTPALISVFFASNDGAAHDVSCTGVSGYNSSDANQFVVKTVSLRATGSQMPLEWIGADFAGAPALLPHTMFSISCNLMPGVGVNDSNVFFKEDVGA